MRLSFTITIFLLLLSLPDLNAQESMQDKLGLPKVDKEPSFKGGQRAWKKFLKKNLIYPEEARQNGIEGKVFLIYNVDVNGVVSNVSEIKSPDPLLTKEAIRVMKISPKWNTAMLDGKAVDRVAFVQIVFKLN